MVVFESQVELVPTNLKEAYAVEDIWILQSTKSMLEAVAHAQLRLNSRVFLFSNQERGITLEEVYRVCNTCELRRNTVSAWQVSPISTLRSAFYMYYTTACCQVHHLDDLWERRSDLSELHFRVCVEHSPPLQIVPADGSRPTGFFPDLFYEIQAKE